MPSPLPDPLSRTRRTRPPARRKGPPLAFIWLGVAAAGVLMLIIVLAAGEGESAPQKRARKPARKAPSKPVAASQLPRPSLSPMPTGPRTLADLMGAPDDGPPDSVTVTSHLAAARSAMAARDVAGMRREVEAARRLAQSPTELGECERVDLLAKSLTAFWKGVETECGRLRSGQELAIGKERMMVVEARADLLTVREAGKIRLYMREDMPAPLAVALAERGLKNSDPNIDLHVGTFHAVDRLGDRSTARRQWTKAGELGQKLLPELDMPTDMPAERAPAL
jgi:hypothetical protein